MSRASSAQNMDALQSLISSLSSANTNAEDIVNHRLMAQRILSSPLVQIKKSEKSNAYLLKKMERSYKKKLQQVDPDKDNSRKVNETMNTVNALYQQILNDNDVDKTLGSDLLILFSKLAGCNADSENSKATSVNPMEFASNTTTSASQQRKTTTTTTFRSSKHEEQAIQNEEWNILRECIHALRYVSGELFQFHETSQEEYKQFEDSERQIYNSKGENDGNFVQPARNDHWDGIRVIFSSMLPFNLTPDKRHLHKYIRTCGGSEKASYDAIHVCAEAGWLYHRIMLYIDHQDSGNQVDDVDRVKGYGVVPRAFASALHKEMDSYHEFLNSLESLHLSSLESKDSGNKLSLRKLMVMLRGPISHLKTLAMIVDGVVSKSDNSSHINGGQLLTNLYLHSMHGDERSTNIANRILHQTSSPWYDLLYDWVINGKLNEGGKSSSTKEFFIVENPSIPDENLWHGRYLVKAEQIPHLPSLGERGGLLSERLAGEVLIVGKGINFIRKCLYDSDWEFDLKDLLSRSMWDSDMNDEQTVNEIKMKLGFHYDARSDCDSSYDISGKGGEIITQSLLEKTVHEAAHQVHKHILSSLFDQYHLVDHLRGLKEILFLGQGDFICTLMDGLHIEFESRKNINEIYVTSLMNIVYDALRTTNAKFFPNHVIDRVNVQLLSPDSKLKSFWNNQSSKEDEIEGWDIFRLDYIVDAPLTAVVHPIAMEKYQLVFDLLFQLKRIEWMMNNTWRQSTTLNHALQLMISKFGTVELGPTASVKSENALIRMNRLLRKFALTRQCMLHFLTNLQSYLMFEVLESGWKELIQKLRGAKTLDEVISSHDEYLDDILEKSLVGEASDYYENSDEEGSTDGYGNELPKQLRLVLSAAFRYCKMHEKIFSDGVETIQSATEKRRGAQKRSSDGEWGFEHFDADVEGLNFYNLADEAQLIEVETLSEDFDMSLRTLLTMLNNRINGNSVRDVDVSSPSLTKPRNAAVSEKAKANKNDALRFLTFRLDFSAYYGL